MHAIVMHSTQPWPANARASIDAAAARWNCDVRVFDFAYAPHPSWARLELAKHLRDYDMVLTLDPDVFISEDCPNVFELAPRTHVCMALELQSLEDRIGPYPWNGALAKWRNQLGRRVSVERHLQGGVCLYSPSLHWQTFERMLGWWNMHGRFSHAPIYEQPMWHEVGERLFGLPMRRMSRLLNRHTRREHVQPQQFIMHLTGGDKHARIQRANWRGPAQEPEEIISAASGESTALRAALRALLHACLFHERILVVGEGMQPAAQVAAQVTSGTVFWLARDSDTSWAHGESQGRVRLVHGEAHSLARQLGVTLMVQQDDNGLPTAITLEERARYSSTAARWWESTSQPDTPIGMIRRRILQTLRGR